MEIEGGSRLGLAFATHARGRSRDRSPGTNSRSSLPNEDIDPGPGFHYRILARHLQIRTVSPRSDQRANSCARSDSEAAALGYIRVVMRAEVGFNKHYGHYALTLAQLVHSGTFTQRMLNPDRGDYTVGYKGKKDNFMLTMTPKNLDPQHRSFYVENDGKIHADETKAADADSPVVETHHF
jgi:hypothetical protein